jgi:uncharacterized protein
MIPFKSGDFHRKRRRAGGKCADQGRRTPTASYDCCSVPKLNLKGFSMRRSMSRFAAVALAAALSCGAGAALAQTKAELVAKVLKLQQPAYEQMAAVLAQQPAMQMMQGAGVVLQNRIAADKRQELAKEIQGDLKKYVDDVVPPVRKRAVELAPSTVGKVLEEKFSEDELKEVIKLLESPAGRKFSQLGSEMQKALSEKLVAEMKPTVEPKVKALEASIAKRLGVSPPAAGASTAK